MKPACHIVALAFAAASLFLGEHSAVARSGVGTGALFSSKGCGISIVFPSSEGNAPEPSLDFIADFSGFLGGKVPACGAMVRFTDNFMIGGWDLSGGSDIFFYAGPGVSAGWVMDKGRRNYGPMAAFSADAGIAVVFRRFPVRMYFGLSADLGIIADRGKYGKGYVLRLYKDGLQRAYFPELKIAYAF